MNRTALRVVNPTPEPQPTYIEVPKAARDAFAEMTAKQRRIEVWMSGSFATSAKREEVSRELAAIAGLAMSVRRML